VLQANQENKNSARKKKGCTVTGNEIPSEAGFLVISNK
jgi:hypothetical protein